MKIILMLDRFSSLEQDFAKLLEWRLTGHSTFTDDIYLKQNGKVQKFNWSLHKAKRFLYLPYSPEICKLLKIGQQEVEEESYSQFALLVLDTKIYLINRVAEFVQGSISDKYLRLLYEVNSAKRYISDYGERGHSGNDFEGDVKRLSRLQAELDTLASKADLILKDIVILGRIGTLFDSNFHPPMTESQASWIAEAIDEAKITYGPPSSLVKKPIEKWFQNTGLSMDDIYPIFSYSLRIDKLQKYRGSEMSPILAFYMIGVCKKLNLW